MKTLGTLEQCISFTVHHVDTHKVRLMQAAGALTPEQIEYRFRLVRENCQAALDQLKKIKDAATAAGDAAVLALLDEATVPYGHDR